MTSYSSEAPQPSTARSWPESPGWLFTHVAIAISAGAYFVSTGLGEIWPLAWVAPIPVLVLAFRASTRKAACAAVAAYFLGGLNMVTYLAKVVPVPIIVLFLLVPALAFAGAVLAARYAALRLPPWAAVFIFPAAWTSYEFLLSLVSPHGTAGSLAYSQTNFLALLQVVSVIGIWGMTFVLTMVPAAVALAFSRRAFSALVPSLAVALLALGYGAIRLQRPAAEPAVRVGLAATDRGLLEAFATEDPSVALSVARAYADRVTRLAAEGAKVVVLPEKFVGVTPADSSDVLKVFNDAARAAHVTLIVGLNGFSTTPRRNIAVVFAPDGQVILEYEKRHLLPGPETGYEVGAKPGLFSALAAQWGVEICKDMDFPAWSRAYGRAGVRILAVPAWDFVRDGRLHSRMAVVRGVENGFAIARAAQQGLLTFSDAYGRVLAEESSASLPDALLVQDITPGPGETFYTLYGDWFGWSCLVVFLVLMIAAAWRTRLPRFHLPSL